MIIILFYIFIICSIIYALFLLAKIRDYTFESQKFLMDILEILKKDNK